MILIKIFVVIGFISMIYVNYLANAPKPINGIPTGEVSVKYQTLFTPAGITFSIWGLIYLLVLIFVIRFVTADAASFAEKKFNLIGILFITTTLFNIAWLFAWHYDKILISTIIMICFLLTLLAILSINQGHSITYITFSIYAGWISVALIANISILLLKYDISLFMSHEWIWFYIVIAISILIGTYMAVVQKNFLYPAVFVWAYVGILMKFLQK